MKIKLSGKYGLSVGDLFFDLTREDLVNLRNQINTILGDQIYNIRAFDYTVPPQEVPRPFNECNDEKSIKFNKDNDGTAVR